MLPDGTERCAKGFADKTATEQEAARREREAARMAAGFVEVEERHLVAPLKDHLDAFLADQERVGRSDKYREILESRITRMRDACGWHTLRAIQPSTVTPFLASLKSDGLAPKTINEYLNGASAFLNWCVQQRRLLANPLANVPTGIRRGELEALRWDDVHVDGLRPYIALRAETTKARRADVVPLRRDVAAELRRAKPADATPETPVFGRIPRMRDLKPDLERAKIDYMDAGGRQADFHSLRMTFGTMLAKSGVAPRTAMELLRHTDIRLTMNVYTDPGILNTAGAVEDLPDVTLPSEAAEAILMGTDGARANISTKPKVLPKSTRSPDAHGHTWAHSGRTNGLGAIKNAGRNVEMVEAVGIEPTSGCPGPEASTRVVGPLNLGPQGSDRQDPSKPSQALVSPATRPTDVPASPCVDVRPRSTGRPGRT